MVDFFISRAGENKQIAITIDGILREAGYTTFIQDTDFGHTDFTDKMDEGFRLVESGTRVIALLSPSYVAKPHCMKEARYPLIEDPSNESQKLIVFRVQEVQPTGFLKAIPYVDLTPYLNDVSLLSSKVLDSVAFIRRLTSTDVFHRVVEKPSYPTATDIDFKSVRVNKALLSLELEDEENTEKTLNKAFLWTLIFAAVLIAFDYGLEMYNRVFDTAYYALFDTSSVIFIALLIIGFMLAALFSQIKKISKSIEALDPSPGELRALREIVALRDWKSKTLISMAVKNATRAIAAKQS